MINKEYGSDLYYFEENNLSKRTSPFESEKISLFFSGRVALFNLLEYGIHKYNWKKVGFPSYYCHEVVHFCEALPIEVVYYNYNPFSNNQEIEWEDNDQNVFINVDFFGVKKIDTSFLVKSVIIDDVTHNLLSMNQSKADYCFGSLRKQLPVGAGGFCMGIREDIDLSVDSNDYANRAGLQKLSAMFLKSEYLLGNFADKETFRNLYMNAESKFEHHQTNAALSDIIKSQLFAVDEEKLIEKTRNNISIAKDNLQLKNCSVFSSVKNTELGIVLMFSESSSRDELKQYLINNKIYPAVLWPSQKNEEDIYFENRFLFIHFDFRYSLEDINFMILKINEFFANA
ncbi:hypothetical protein [uncultured Chryseobacterium sp.]|jgi:hypothetical protein|uniref:hypothetical protein n=1 Tax=uncultured Chryseobacterium sp. TaxID=259322 RepID=UPI0026041B76|nr:hypothetical protein [uncultured Chryseobacterium sp.]